MAPNFTFPPPPPPPPAVPSVSNASGNSRQHLGGLPQRRGRGRGGGGNPRGGSGARQRFDWDRPVQHHDRPFHHGNPNQPARMAHQGAQKRNHQQAFTGKAKTVPSITAPPAVPSFGDPLPTVSKPVAQMVSIAGVKVKKDRTFNQLGLTPRKEEHESSEDDDEDEEAKLGATSLNLGHNGLQFEHKGQLMTLQTPDDIQAWIAERKKRYPTKAKIAEAAAAKSKVAKHPIDRPGKALHREKQRSLTSKKTSNSAGHNGHIRQRGGKLQEGPQLKSHTKSIPSSSKRNLQEPREGHHPNHSDTSDSLLNTSSESEDTSSSGDSEATDDSDDAPTEQSAKVIVAALPSMVKKARRPPRSELECQRLRKTGRCRIRGCSYRHDFMQPESNAAASNEPSRSRVPLYQRLLARQHDDDDRDLLRHIVAIGDRGLLQAKD